MIISAAAGDWFVTSTNVTDLNTTRNTAWRLFKSHTLSIVLNQATATIALGESVALTAETNIAQEVTWSSSDENVATVDASGVVTAVADGVATITATAGMLKATCVVTVGAGEDDGVATSTADASMQLKDGVITFNGLAHGTEVYVYDTAGSLIGSAVAANGTAAVNTGLAAGSTVIVKVGEKSLKLSLK